MRIYIMRYKKFGVLLKEFSIIILFHVMLVVSCGANNAIAAVDCRIIDQKIKDLVDDIARNGKDRDTDFKMNLLNDLWNKYCSKSDQNYHCEWFETQCGSVCCPAGFVCVYGKCR